MFSSSSHAPPAPYPFQTYILPTQPFRRRRSSTATSPSSSGLYPSLSPPFPTTSQDPISPTYTSSSRSPHERPRRSSYLQNHTSHISCARCKASLALSSQIISKGFTGRHGRALLVSPSSLDTAAVPTGSPSSSFPNARRKSSRTLSTGSSGNGAMIRESIGGTAEQGDVVRPLPPAPTRRRSSALSNAFSAAVSLATSPFSPSTTSTSTTPQSYTPTSGSWLSRSLSSTTTSPPSSSTSPTSPSSFRSSPNYNNSHTKQAPTPPTTLPNTRTHPAVPRHLVTGLHTVADVSCTVCSSVLGWKYISTEEEAQRYKVGKYILETKRVVVGSEWEGGGGIGEGEGNGDGSVFEFEEEGEGEGVGVGEDEDDREERREGRQEEDADEEESDEDEDEDEEDEQDLMLQQVRQSDGRAAATTPSTTTVTRPSQSQSQSQPQHNTRIRFTSTTHPRNTHTAPIARNANSYHDSFHTSYHTSYHNNDDPSSDENDEVLFDSQDEDECDDLFAGMWSPQVARLRRDSKRGDGARGM